MKSCSNCDHCKVLIKKRPDPLNSEFSDFAVTKVACSLGLLPVQFTSMAAFNASALPKMVAEECEKYINSEE